MGAVRASAPIRICDNGGWTDTWFARYGNVFNIAVTPSVDVAIEEFPLGVLEDRVTFDVVDYQDRYAFDPATPPGRHPILEAVVDEARLPRDASLAIRVHSGAPPGSSTGTSAAICVALVGALDALTPGRLSPYQVATAAHRIESELMGVQSGVQDQLSAAFGGINYIEISPYPHATLTRLSVTARTWGELDARLLLVYLGRAHASSPVHDLVIAKVQQEPSESARVLDALRRAATEARDAVLAGDLAALGMALRRNNEAQADLHRGLVGSEARTAIDVAAAEGALGWKVNGAGGEGGSISVLVGADPSAPRNLASALRAANPQFRVIPTTLSRNGLHVSSSQGDPNRDPPAPVGGSAASS